MPVVQNEEYHFFASSVYSLGCPQGHRPNRDQRGETEQGGQAAQGSHDRVARLSRPRSSHAALSH